jgi:hypothetical protein
MALSITAERARTRVLSEAHLLPATVVLAWVWAAGLTVDVWYHLHLGFQIESFFTPAHAVLYGAMGVTGFPALLYLLDSIRLGVPRKDWLPAGYIAILVGWSLYGMGGGFDFLWHSLIGFEANYDAVLSPSHTWLAAAYLILTFGLVKASALWRTRQGPLSARLRWADVPLLIGLGLLLRTLAWFLTYVSPLTADYATGGAKVGGLDGYAGIAWTNLAAHMAGATGIFIDGLLVSLVVVAAVRYLRIPTGGIVIILLTYASVVVPATEQWLAVPAMVVAGVVAEVIAAGLKGEPAGYWLLGLSIPLVQTLTLFALQGVLGGGLVWAPHLWLGVPIVAGIYGAVAAMFAVPPAWLRQMSS